MYPNQFQPQYVYPTTVQQQYQSRPVYAPQTSPIHNVGTTKKALDNKFPNGITMTWNVNAHVVKKRDNIIQKIRNRFSKPSEEQQPTQMNPYYPNYSPYNREVEDPNIKRILKNVSGCVQPGQMCAIMGASGSGKTTLLNVLNFRNQGKMIIDGDIRINGKQVDWEDITAYSAYVQQLDLFIGTLTVREQLTFCAMLKMGKEYTEEEKYARVEELLNELNLFKCQDTRIGAGDLMKGISGGEKRRLAFGSEIVTNPSLLFCDEPTSGLDSFMAETVVDLLLNLARQKKTMICTIHQPSSQIFEKFDWLCLLSEGRVAYMGPTKEAYNHFANLGFRCPNTYNPADYYIQVLAIKPAQREMSLAKAKRICDGYDNSDYKRRIVGIIQQQTSNPTYFDHESARKTLRDWYSSSYLTQFRWLLWREGLNVLRNPIATYILLAQSLFLGVFFGLTFLRVTLDETGVQNIIGILFLILMQCNFGYIFSVTNSLPMELPVLYREVKNRLYSVYYYFLAKQVADFPKFLLFPTVLVTIVYWMSGISNSVRLFFILVSLFAVTVQCGVSFGYFLSAASPSLDVALALAIPILMPMLIFAGLFLNNDTTPGWLIWIKYISWFFYTNEAVQIQYWQTIDTIPCSKSTILTPNSTCPVQSNGCFKDGSQVLKNRLNFNESNFSRDLGLLFLLIFVYRAGTAIILKLKTMRR